MNNSMILEDRDYLSIERTTALKGLLALGIILCHVVPASGIVKGSILSPLFGSLGYLCVAVFFFLSGYGIMAQYLKDFLKKYLKDFLKKYLKDFLKNRVLSIYLLNLFLVVLYGLFRVLTGTAIPLTQVVQSLLIGNTIVSNGWYLQIVMVFYLFWYISVRYIPKEQTQFPVLCVLVLGYMLIGLIFLSSFWYQSSLGFLMGVYWSRNQQKLDTWLLKDRKRILCVLAASFAAFCVLYFLTVKGTVINAQISIVFRRCMSFLSAAMFVIIVVTSSILLHRVISCGLFRFLGIFSMELYVLQGIPLHILKVGRFAIENGWLYIVGVMAGTVLLAVVLHPVIRFVTNIPKKYLQ